LRVVTTSTLAQSIVPALLQAFTARAGGIEVSLGVATTEEMTALVEERLADVALGPRLSGVDAEAVMRYRMTLVGHPELRINGGGLAGLRWFVDPTGTDRQSDVGVLLAKYRVPESQIMVFANEKAAWSAAAAGGGVAPAIDHMVSAEVDRGVLARLSAAEMPVDLLLYVNSLESTRRSQAADRLRRFVRTPDAMHAMYRPDSGVPAAKFRPPVYVTLWS
jgi:DNA-binding transcriptional LysR family regulator